MAPIFLTLAISLLAKRDEAQNRQHIKEVS
jgi:hypothetical protein